MTILHATQTLDGASGVATFVRELAAALAARGVGGAVATEGAPGPRGDFDLLHVHGLWRPLFHRLAAAARRAGTPVVWSPHGMLAPWSLAHKRWKKTLAWRLYQRRDLARARLLHATVPQEEGWIRACGLENAVAVVPLGTHLPDLPAVRPDATMRPTARTLLFVGRLHPVKGLANLVRAWAAARPDGWRLRLVGPDEAGHRAELERLVARLDAPRVAFAGPRFGAELQSEYAACDALVLPSFTENFGATVAEALAHAKPCIASTATPWRELAAQRCGWWVDNAPDALASALRELAALDDATRRAMGARGRRLVEARYTWASVAEALHQAYARCASNKGGVLHVK